MDCIESTMLEIGADGVVFIPIMHHSINIRENNEFILCEYTLAEWIEGVDGFPKSQRKYYKIINGKKLYYDFNLQDYR